MAVNVTINGQSFLIPSQGDSYNWGTGVTNWIVAVTSEALFTQGGNFTLLSPVNFGTSFGLIAPYFASAASGVSNLGVVRLAANDSIVWPNAANTLQYALNVNNGVLTFNGSAVGTGITSGNTSNITVTTSGASVNIDTAITATKLGALVGLTASNTSNISITSNGSGNLIIDTKGSGGGIPSGSNTQVQFNNNGVFGGAANLAYNVTTGYTYAKSNVSISPDGGTDSWFYCYSGSGASGCGLRLNYQNSNVNYMDGNTQYFRTASGATNILVLTSGQASVTGTLAATSNVNAGGTLNGAVPGANVTGTVASATSAATATLASTVTTTSTASGTAISVALASGTSINYTTSVQVTASTGTLSATILNATSDANLKSDITTIKDSSHIIAGLNGVRYNWKVSGLPSAGLIAQDVQKVLPEAVAETNGKLSLNYNAIIGVLVEEVKALRAELNALKGSI